MVWTDIFGQWQFYALLVALGTVFSAFASRMGLFKLPILSKQALLYVGVVGLVITTGIFGSVIMSTGTASLGDAPAGFYISDLQVTTAFTSDNAGIGNVTESSGVQDHLDVRLLDAAVSETGGEEEVYTGILTVTRTGAGEPYSCVVQAELPADYGDEAGDDGRRYNIVEKTTTGEWEVYLNDGGAAVITSPKDHTTLSFDDGESQTTLGIAVEVDEEGHDALNQYSSKNIVVNICGRPFTIEIHRMD